jgi:hypothetical protein
VSASTTTTAILRTLALRLARIDVSPHPYLLAIKPNAMTAIETALAQAIRDRTIQ